MNVGIVGLKWNILEQADGVVIQLVYAGPPSTEIQASGVIEGQHDIHQLKGRVNAETKYVNRKYDRLLNIFEGYGFIAVGIIMPFACYFSFRAKYPLSKWNAIIRTPDIVGVMFSFICIATGIYSLVFLPPNPPFGF